MTESTWLKCLALMRNTGEHGRGTLDPTPQVRGHAQSIKDILLAHSPTTKYSILMQRGRNRSKHKRGKGVHLVVRQLTCKEQQKA